MKKINIQIRISEPEKKAFKEKCQSLDTSMSAEIKRFIRWFVDEQKEEK